QVKNVETGIVRSTLSDLEGRFRFPDLAIGDYEVQAMKPGFQTVLHRGITLTLGTNPVVDFAMPIGQVQQTVDVVGEISQVDVTTSSVGHVVEQTQMR